MIFGVGISHVEGRLYVSYLFTGGAFNAVENIGLRYQLAESIYVLTSWRYPYKKIVGYDTY